VPRLAQPVCLLSAGHRLMHAALKGAKMERQDRRRFLTRAGAATGAAAFVGIPGIAGISERPPELVEAPSAVTHDPVVVYIRDAARGEVTVMHGSRETTYRDRSLVKRLLKAARATSESAAWEVK
jgi:hypothetical protein